MAARAQGKAIMAAGAQGIRSHCFCSQEADRCAHVIPSLPLVCSFWYSSLWSDATYRPLWTHNPTRDLVCLQGDSKPHQRVHQD